MKYKFDLYEEAGVLEYWIVNPADKTVFIYILKENQFIGMHPLIESTKKITFKANYSPNWILSWNQFLTKTSKPFKI